jgi:tRNA pseudouridine55 synthase
VTAGLGDAIGFLSVDKPAGRTSHDVVTAVRRATGIKKVGHAGTLDPMATGVVVVAVGRATRLIRFVQDTVKEYVATARFGEQTDTLDADGEISSRAPMDVTRDQIERAAEAFVGEIMQVPPMVSALKVGGRRLYELAREGTEVERAARPVEVYELEILDVGPPPFPDVELRVRCGKGTYIRSLADDLARTLGGGAHLIALRRTAVGSFVLPAALAVDELPARWKDCLIPPSTGLGHLPSITVENSIADGIRHGRKFGRPLLDGVLDGAPYRVLSETGDLVAVYANAGSVSKPEVVLA